MKSVLNWLMVALLAPSLMLSSGCSSDDSIALAPVAQGDTGIAKTTAWYECMSECDYNFSECSLQASANLDRCASWLGGGTYCWAMHNLDLSMCESTWQSCVDVCDALDDDDDGGEKSRLGDTSGSSGKPGN